MLPFPAPRSICHRSAEGRATAGPSGTQPSGSATRAETPALVQFSFLHRNQTNPAPADVFNDTMPPGDTRRYDNAVNMMFGLDNAFGAIMAVSDQRLLINSRIYNLPVGGEGRDSVGQFFAAVPTEFAIAAGQVTELLGVYQTQPDADSEFRYNFGFVEPPVVTPPFALRPTTLRRRFSGDPIVQPGAVRSPPVRLQEPVRRYLQYQRPAAGGGRFGLRPGGRFWLWTRQQLKRPIHIRDELPRRPAGQRSAGRRDDHQSDGWHGTDRRRKLGRCDARHR